jgi:8-oxo-dGTP pyrophosphatase MutT (NUDIX family)
MKYAVQVVLLNNKQEVLAVSRKDDHTDFGLIGGKVDPEDKGLEEAMVRECKEETGLDITNFVLIFSMHKDGYMGYTYLADWEGDIFTTENHVVKWVAFEEIYKGSFGKWNKLVGMSLKSMGVEIKEIDIMNHIELVPNKK